MSVLVIMFLYGCSSYTLENIEQINPEEITLKEARQLCYDKANECDEGIPAIRAEFRNACFQIYYYTGDVE